MAVVFLEKTGVLCSFFNFCQNVCQISKYGYAIFFQVKIVFSEKMASLDGNSITKVLFLNMNSVFHYAGERLYMYFFFFFFDFFELDHF